VRITPISSLVAFAGVLLGVGLSATQAFAQSLRGSRASVRVMHHYALEQDLEFYTTRRSVRAAEQSGSLTRLEEDGNLVLEKVSFPYVKPFTALFVERLAAQYRDACNEQMVVTSAVRPVSNQPANASSHSVHPTGIAVDLRKPKGKCLSWLRGTLLSLEGEGVIEATEERHPAHFHIAVFGRSYERYLQNAGVRIDD
jgi:hypothetical protein